MPNVHQEMPPPGGYSPFNLNRVPARKIFNGYILFAGYLAVTLSAQYIWFMDKRKTRKLQREHADVMIALEPFLLAERDRLFLKQIRKNRDEEAELMKDVPGWKVGTLYGEPLYKTLSKDTFFEPCLYEYYAHTSLKNLSDYRRYNFWN